MSELALRLIEENKKTRSTFLDLGNCGLTEVPEEVGELVWVEKLSFSQSSWEKNDFDIVWEYYRTTVERKTLNTGKQNSITHLPNPLSNLINLKILILSGNPLSDLSILSNMNTLHAVDCSNTLVDDLSPILQLVKKNHMPVIINSVYEGSNYESVSYRQFTLPEHIDNTCAAATHYFYQQDLYSCGQSAYPIEMHNNIKPLSPCFNFKQ